ncbi:MAG: GntR family transcriptional regulator [Amnibacterium sp.]
MPPQPGAAAPVPREGSRRLWEQAAARIEAELAEAAAGTRLPSEAEQAARLGVSRVTIRQALLSLQRRGLIESSPGRGWFLAEDPAPAPAGGRPLFEPPGRLMGFSAMARTKGSSPDSVVLEQSSRPATFEEADALSIMPGDELLVLRRVRRLNGAPVAVDRSLVPLFLVPDALALDFATGSLQEALTTAGSAPVTADTEVEAMAADAELAALLKVPVDFPLLKIRQAFFDSTGRPVERGLIIYRGDRYRFRSRLHS